MSHPLIVHSNKNDTKHSGNKTFSYVSNSQNDLFIKNVPIANYVRYTNDNPHIVLNKNTQELPLSYKMNLLNGTLKNM